MSYVQGFLLAVPEENRARYVEMAQAGWALFSAHGAREMVETWEVDVPEGEHTSFPMAVKRAPGEKIVFSWVIWPDKATAEACFATMESDPRWAQMPEMCWDGKRMIWGGFEPVFTAGTAEG